MQNKGFVKVFAVLLTLVCLFYLSFSFVTQHYNSKAAEYAGGDPAKESAYLDSLSTQKVWLGYTLKQCREMEISLGLDLKGGMNVVLELNVADVIRSLSNNNQDENFNKALDLAYAHQATSQKDFIDLFAEEYKKLDSGARLSAIFSTFELKDKITPQSSDAQVVSVLNMKLHSGELISLIAISLQALILICFAYNFVEPTQVALLAPPYPQLALQALRRIQSLDLHHHHLSTYCQP